MMAWLRVDWLKGRDLDFIRFSLLWVEGLLMVKIEVFDSRRR